MIRKTKSIEEIYHEVKEYDLVITNDAPLATALNKLVQHVRLDYFAMTPRQIASKFANIYFDRTYEKYEIVLYICKRVNKPLKIIHQMVEKIFEVWIYNAKLEFTDPFLTNEEKDILKYLAEYKSIETAMEHFNEDFYRNKKIAVAGRELFNLIDLEVLPKRGSPPAVIEIFKKEEYSIDKTFLFQSSKDLIEKTIGFIKEANAGEIAIVLNPESEYLEILKARLKERKINIEIKNYLSGDISTRNILSMIELSLRIDDIKVKEFSSIATFINSNIEAKYHQYDLSNYIKYFNKSKNLKRLYELMESCVRLTYDTYISKMEDYFDIKIHPDLQLIIDLLELNKKQIDESNLTDIKYFLKVFDVELQAEKSGVLFVNALTSSFVDRQIVIYLGLDHSWTRFFSDKDYFNRSEEEVKALNRFQILLQQGKQRFYFTQHIKNNVNVIPCYYFNLLVDKEIGGFIHKSFNPVTVNTSLEKKPKLLIKNIIHPNMPEEITTISPSRLNNYIKCPKKYAFSTLIPGEDSQVFKKGILFHNFAELYVNHKNFTKNNLQIIIDLMVEKLSYFAKDFNIELFKTEFMVGTDAIINFIDSQKVNLFNLDEPKEPEDNELMKELNKKIIYANTEQWVIDTEVTKIKGKIDLQYGNTIVDYKSSKTRKFETDVTLQSNLTYILEYEKEDFDFQAVSYVSAMRNYHNEINFIYNYLLSNLKNQINPLQRSETNLTRIKYLPQTFFEYILSKEVYEKLKKKDKLQLFLETIGYKSYKFILKNLNLKEKEYFDQKTVEEKIIAVGNELVFNTLGHMTGDFKKNSMKTFTNDIMRLFASSIHCIRIGKVETALIFKDDIEKFLILIKDKIELINRYQLSDFPFAPIYNSREVCKECDYLNICIGNKLWNW